MKIAWTSANDEKKRRTTSNGTSEGQSRRVDHATPGVCAHYKERDTKEPDPGRNNTIALGSRLEGNPYSTILLKLHG